MQSQSGAVFAHNLVPAGPRQFLARTLAVRELRKKEKGQFRVGQQESVGIAHAFNRRARETAAMASSALSATTSNGIIIISYDIIIVILVHRQRDAVVFVE